MSFSVILLTVVGAIAAGFTSGLSGFAFGLVGLSIWAWVLDPHLLAPIVVAGSLVSQLVSFIGLRQKIDWPRAVPFMVGGVVGVPFGVLALSYIDLHWFRGVTGAVMIVYCAGMLMMANLPPITHGGPVADGVVGLIGGIMGGLAGMTGPVPTLWCSLRRWDKQTQRVVFQTYNFLMQSMTLASYAVSGSLTPAFAQLFVYIVPAVLISTWFGTKLYSGLSDVAFRRLILVLLLISGCVLVAGSV